MVDNDMYLFPAPKVSVAKVVGEQRGYPINRIFCVGRNYAAHAREMGVEPDRTTPFYFMKPASAYVSSGEVVVYPPGTNNYHYEMELVVALGKSAFRVAEEDALDCVYGYATGLDMTRRDLQLEARDKGRPWELGKSFEESAVLGDILPAKGLHLNKGKIELSVNGDVKQSSDVAMLIWSVPEIISHLSKYYHLRAGDLVYTGTPEGVGPAVPGDRLEGVIDGLPSVNLMIADG